MSMTERRTAIVTGGTRGIGLAISTRLATDGYDLLVTYQRDAESATRAQEDLSKLGGKVELLAADISTAEGAATTIETALDRLGRIDVLVNNAGITRDTLVMRMSESDWDDVVDTNLKGAFLVCKAVMRPGVGGRRGRPDRQPDVGRRAGRQRWPGELRLGQGGPDRPDEVSGQGGRVSEHHRQRGRARVHPDEAHRRPEGRAEGRHPDPDPARPLRPAGRRCRRRRLPGVGRRLLHYGPRPDHRRRALHALDVGSAPRLA